MKKQIKAVAKGLSMTIALGLLSQSVWAEDELDKLPLSEVLSEQDQHSVAYRVKKILFGVKKVIVVGKSNSFKTSLEKKGDQARVVVSVPWTSFDSQDQDRDESVAEHMGSEYPKIVFTSDWTPIEEIKQARTSDSLKVKGNLAASGSSEPVEASAVVKQGASDFVVETTLYTTFSHIKVKAPSGGVASIKDDLHIYGRFQVSQVEGLEAILQ